MANGEKRIAKSGFLVRHHKVGSVLISVAKEDSGAVGHRNIVGVAKLEVNDVAHVKHRIDVEGCSVRADIGAGAFNEPSLSVYVGDSDGHTDVQAMLGTSV